MVDDDALRAAVSTYVRLTTGDYEMGEALYRLTDHALQVLGCDGAGVSVADPESRLRFVTATEQRVVVIEEEQAIEQEGPCFEAYRTRETVVTADLEDEERWPRYRSAALEMGFRAVAGVPMAIEDMRIGAMNLYHEQPHDWTPEELEAARLLGDMASGYIANHRTLTRSRAVADPLETALESRVVIEQAKGAVAAASGISVAGAFDRLRAHARSERRKLHDVARDVVEGRLRL